MSLPKPTIYWIFSVTLAIWFLFIHSPPIILERHGLSDIPFVVHLFAAYSIYIVCIINTLITPSTFNGKAYVWHVWIGRVGMISGLISFILGAYCAWWPYRINRPSFGFSIGITIGGISQIAAQCFGYTAIRRYQALKAKINELEMQDQQGNEIESFKLQRDSALRFHVGSMVLLFVVACGIPAGMRLVTSYVPENLQTVFIVLLVSLLVVITRPFTKNYFRKKLRDHTQQDVVDVFESQGTTGDAEVLSSEFNHKFSSTEPDKLSIKNNIED
jgi:hypothetical protein